MTGLAPLRRDVKETAIASGGSRRRLSIWSPSFAWTVGGLIASLVLVAPFAAIAGANVVDAYTLLFESSITSWFGLGNTLRMATPLILVSVGVAIPYRAKVFNLGGEGQLLTGALAAALVGIYVPVGGGLDIAFLLPLAAAVVAGAALGLIPGWLYARRGVNEIVTTIMINFLALYLVEYLVSGPLRDRTAAYSTSKPISDGFRILAFGGPANVPLGFVIAVIVTLAIWYASISTRTGAKLDLIGANSVFAQRQGVNLRVFRAGALLIGGAFAGMGGGLELLGNQYRIGQDFSPGWGFTAIAVAVLARGNLLGVLGVALYFAALRNGSQAVGAGLGIPGGIVFILQAAPVIVLAAVMGVRGIRSSELAGK